MLFFVISPGRSCIRAPSLDQTSYLYRFLCEFKNDIKPLAFIDTKKVTNGKAVQKIFLKRNDELFCTVYFFLLFFTTPRKFDLQSILYCITFHITSLSVTAKFFFQGVMGFVLEPIPVVSG